MFIGGIECAALEPNKTNPLERQPTLEPDTTVAHAVFMGRNSLRMSQDRRLVFIGGKECAAMERARRVEHLLENRQWMLP